jgi:hypothetical protein
MSDRENARSDGKDEQEGTPRRAAGNDRRGCDADAWWEERSLPQKILLGIGFGILGIGFVALFGWVLMLLWNWLMPEIFGLKQLNYWQSWGVLILCCILFKGINFGSDSSSRRSDRKRKRQLRRYMREDKPPAGEAQPDSPQP